MISVNASTGQPLSVVTFFTDSALYKESKRKLARDREVTPMLVFYINFRFCVSVLPFHLATRDIATSFNVQLLGALATLLRT